MPDVPTTRWSQLLLGRSPDDSGYDEAWQYLFETYRRPIERYIRRRAGDADAAEWTDEFLAAWVEGKLDGADPDIGRFRQYLFTSLRNFCHMKHRAGSRWTRLTRLVGGDVMAEQIASEDAEASEAFCADFAHGVMARALAKLERYELDKAATQRPNRYHALIQAFYIKPAEDARPAFSDLADLHGLTEKAVERQLERARSKLREWITAELREMVSTEDELAEEIELLLSHWRVPISTDGN